jgi:5-formyltetrahydrofolate cyclo-ligase
MTKAELRKIYLTKRRELSQTEVDTFSAKIESVLLRDFDLTGVKFLHCFISTPKFNEVDTRPIFQRIWREYPQVTTLVPRIDHDADELETLSYGEETELVHNRWHIGEPAHNERIDPKKIDIVLVPLLCFDKRGHRVGYGRGYYDRFLSRCRPDCKKIGLSFFGPVDEIEDVHEGDVELDHCVAPDGVITIEK